MFNFLILFFLHWHCCSSCPFGSQHTLATLILLSFHCKSCVSSPGYYCLSKHHVWVSKTALHRGWSHFPELLFCRLQSHLLYRLCVLDVSPHESQKSPPGLSTQGIVCLLPAKPPPHCLERGDAESGAQPLTFVPHQSTRHGCSLSSCFTAANAEGSSGHHASLKNGKRPPVLRLRSDQPSFTSRHVWKNGLLFKSWENWVRERWRWSSRVCKHHHQHYHHLTCL